MNTFIKSLLLFAVIYLSIFVTACDSSYNTSTYNISNSIEAVDTTSINFSEDLLSYFPSAVGSTYNFSGSLEHAHSLEVVNIVKNEENSVLSLEGKIEKTSNETSDEYLSFNTTISIYEDKVIENTSNTKRTDITSIIPNQVILKSPLTLNSSWEQEFKIDDSVYTAVTTITELGINEDNKKYISTETIVAHINDYDDNVYVQNRTFVENLGLCSYSASTEYGFNMSYNMIKE